MAKFFQFRVFVALLAAFGGFFAYVCRLNLSLVIHEMANDEVPMVPAITEGGATNASQGAHGDTLTSGQPSALKLSNLRHEDQALAELSAARRSWRLRGPLTGPLGSRRRNSSAPRLAQPQDSVAMLSSGAHEFNVDRAARSSNLNVAGQQQEQQQEQQEQQQQLEQKADETFVERMLNPLPKLDWSPEARNDLLGAFFLGYVIFQVPAARAAEMFGAKSLIMLSGLGTGLTSLLFVLSARLLGDAIWCAWLVRFLMGGVQAGLYPAIYVLFCQWLPASERAYWLPLPSAMGRFGTIAMNFFAPMIVRQHGWPMVFVVSALVTLAWSLVFLVFVSSEPAQSRWLPASELLHLQARLQVEPAKQRQEQLQRQVTRELKLRQAAAASCDSIDELESQQQQLKPPSDSVDWLKIVTNGPLAVLTLVMFSSDWSNMLLLVLLPGFLGPALGMELETVGFWTICLVAVYCFGYPLSGALASRLERAEQLQLGSLTIRKLFEASAHLMQAAGCLMIAVSRSQPIIIIALFLIMLGRSTVGGGQCLMPPELSRDYPGTVMAYGNAMSSLAGFFGPKIVNLLVSEPRSRDSWDALWFVSAGLFLACGLVFVLLADNSPQQFGRTASAPTKSISQVRLTLPPYLPPPQMLAAADEPPAQLSARDLAAKLGDVSPAEEAGRGETKKEVASEKGAEEAAEVEDVRAPKRKVIKEEIRARMSAFTKGLSTDPAGPSRRA